MRRDGFLQKVEFLKQIFQIHKLRVSSLLAPFWTTNALLTTCFSGSRSIRMDLDACAVQTQNFTLNIYNVLFLKLIENSLYGSVFRPSAKSHVNCMPVPEFFWQCPPLAAIFYYNNAFKNCWFDIFAGFLSIGMSFFIFSICFSLIFICFISVLYVNTL